MIRSLCDTATHQSNRTVNTFVVDSCRYKGKKDFGIQQGFMMQLWGQLMYDAVGAQECSIV